MYTQYNNNMIIKKERKRRRQKKGKKKELTWHTVVWKNPLPKVGHKYRVAPS
jgi:hypothetical protein